MYLNMDKIASLPGENLLSTMNQEDFRRVHGVLPKGIIPVSQWLEVRTVPPYNVLGAMGVASDQKQAVHVLFESAYRAALRADTPVLQIGIQALRAEWEDGNFAPSHQRYEDMLKTDIIGFPEPRFYSRNIFTKLFWAAIAWYSCREGEMKTFWQLEVYASEVLFWVDSLTRRNQGLERRDLEWDRQREDIRALMSTPI